MWLRLAVPLVGLQCVIVVFLEYIIFFFNRIQYQRPLVKSA